MSVSWGYCRENGPHTWEKYFPGARGSKQSPIDIQSAKAKVLRISEPLTYKYDPKSAIDIVNTGFGWKISVNGGKTELIGGLLKDKYILAQYHCHWAETSDKGSEHTIDGNPYAGELHFVHWNASKYSSIEEAIQDTSGLAIFAVFIKPGERNSEIEKIVSYLPQIEYKDQKLNITEAIDPMKMLPNICTYYTYSGSITIPPCLECAMWIVYSTPIEISEKQLEAFRKLKSYCYNEPRPNDEFKGYVKSNFRPTQPVSNREIQIVTCCCKK